MTNLLSQLTELKGYIGKLTDKNQYLSSELARIKTQPSISSEQMSAVQTELNNTQQRIEKLEQLIVKHEQQHAELENRYQSLADSHSILSNEYEQAQAQIETLTQTNQKLIEKNHVASEHTKLVLERLAKIDSEN
ncbi:hypothetical protein [Faucicola boevrei]|uniref:hypothetical protein n=1 Tax=Faucicola boevrei TaxID=346665 RepID=UPI0003692BDB|nr:hypothetical protein [Moraxella boevrei]